MSLYYYEHKWNISRCWLWIYWRRVTLIHCLFRFFCLVEFWGQNHRESSLSVVKCGQNNVLLWGNEWTVSLLGVRVRLFFSSVVHTVCLRVSENHILAKHFVFAVLCFTRKRGTYQFLLLFVMWARHHARTHITSLYLMHFHSMFVKWYIILCSLCIQ